MVPRLLGNVIEAKYDYNIYVNAVLLNGLNITKRRFKINDRRNCGGQYMYTFSHVCLEKYLCGRYLKRELRS